MSHPTEPIHDPSVTDASLGVSNVFEVEETAPDGGSASTDAPLAAAKTPPVSEIPPSPPKAPPESEPDDDAEPPPQLVWYVLKVQSGREDTIRDAFERRVKIQGLGNYFGRIVVPTEKTTEIRNNKKKVVERKSYPGYIMVEMELNEKTWFTVRETPGVGDFVGAHGQPTKMTETEVNQMLGQQTAPKPRRLRRSASMSNAATA